MALHTFRRFLVIVPLAVLALPAQALAQTPAPNCVSPSPCNDAYLQSIPVNRRGEELPQDAIKDIRDTSATTTQTDLFAPPATGGGAERLDCSGTTYGKTVWYDMHPTINGTADIKAAGLDAAISVYEFDPATSRITSRLNCVSEPGGISEEMLVDVKAGKSYTIQIGGISTAAGPAGGMLEFTFEFFGNRDGDTFLDALDKCPMQPGTQDGCPRELRATPTLRAAPTAKGIKIASLRVEAPKGAKVRARCKRRCRFTQTRTVTGEAVSFSRLRGRSLRAGAVLEVLVTKPDSIGVHTSWKISRGGFKRTNRCLQPGSTRPSKCP